MSRFDVVGVGRAACDYVVRLDHYPGRDEKVRAEDFLVEGGGTVGTALVTLARLGFSAAFAGALGDDDFGRFVLAGLEREGVDTSLSRIEAGARSPFAFCVSVPPSRNVFSVPPTTLPLDLSGEVVERLLDTRFLHLDGSEEDASLALAREARKREVAVSLDLQRRQPLSGTLLGLAELVVVSASFARETLGERDPLDAVRALYRPGMRLAAITLGEQGAVACVGGEPFAVPAETVEVVDTTGAGDVFHGALLAALLRGHAVPDSLRFATHVAALACTSLGGRAGIPRRDEVSDWI